MPANPETIPALVEAVKSLTADLEFYDNFRSANGTFDPEAVRTILTAMPDANRVAELEAAMRAIQVYREGAAHVRFPDKVEEIIKAVMGNEPRTASAALGPKL